MEIRVEDLNEEIERLDSALTEQSRVVDQIDDVQRRADQILAEDAYKDYGLQDAHLRIARLQDQLVEVGAEVEAGAVDNVRLQLERDIMKYCMTLMEGAFIVKKQSLSSRDDATALVQHAVVNGGIGSVARRLVQRVQGCLRESERRLGDCMAHDESVAQAAETPNGIDSPGIPLSEDGVNSPPVKAWDGGQGSDAASDAASAASAASAPSTGARRTDYLATLSAERARLVSVLASEARDVLTSRIDAEMSHVGDAKGDDMVAGVNPFGQDSDVTFLAKWIEGRVRRVVDTLPPIVRETSKILDDLQKQRKAVDGDGRETAAEGAAPAADTESKEDKAAMDKAVNAKNDAVAAAVKAGKAEVEEKLKAVQIETARMEAATKYAKYIAHLRDDLRLEREEEGQPEPTVEQLDDQVATLETRVAVLEESLQNESLFRQALYRHYLYLSGLIPRTKMSSVDRRSVKTVSQVRLEMEKLRKARPSGRAYHDLTNEQVYDLLKEGFGHLSMQGAVLDDGWLTDGVGPVDGLDSFWSLPDNIFAPADYTPNQRDQAMPIVATPSLFHLNLEQLPHHHPDFKDGDGESNHSAGETGVPSASGTPNLDGSRRLCDGTSPGTDARLVSLVKTLRERLSDATCKLEKAERRNHILETQLATRDEVVKRLNGQIESAERQRKREAAAERSKKSVKKRRREVLFSVAPSSRTAAVRI